MILSVLSDRDALGVSLAELISTFDYQKAIRKKQQELADINEDTKYITREDTYRMLPDVFKSEFLGEEFKNMGIYEDWFTLPIEKLFHMLKNSFSGFLSQDIDLLQQNENAIIDEIVYQLYIFPSLAKIACSLTQLKPSQRPNDEEFDNMILKVEKLQRTFEELKMTFREYVSDYKIISNLPLIKTAKFEFVPEMYVPDRANINMTAKNKHLTKKRAVLNLEMPKDNFKSRHHQI